jgi:hypothetical protein
MEKNYSKYWMSFVEKGHMVRKNPTGKMQFEINNVSFELQHSPPVLRGSYNKNYKPMLTNEWFRLYRVKEEMKYDMLTTRKEMIGSDFYLLGRKDIHDMADDGIKHLTLARQEH